MAISNSTDNPAAPTPHPSTETPPHLRGPIIQAYADANGIPPEEAQIAAARRPVTVGSGRQVMEVRS